MEATRANVIDFLIAAFKEAFYGEKKKIHYYGHNFNNTFRGMPLDVQNGIYMAFVLMLEYGEYDRSNSFRFDVFVEWLKELKKKDSNPSGTMLDNANLKWNLYYQLKRIASNHPLPNQSSKSCNHTN